MTLLTQNDWQSIRMFAEGMGRRYAAGIRSLGKGKTEQGAPVAEWIRSGVATMGRPAPTPRDGIEAPQHSLREHCVDGRTIYELRVWRSDGSAVQDAVQMAMLTTYRMESKNTEGHALETHTQLVERVRNSAARRTQWHLRRWNSAPGRYIPSKGERSGENTGKAVAVSMRPIDEYDAEVESKSATVQCSESTEVDPEALLALLRSLSDDHQTMALKLMAWCESTGKRAGGVGCPVHSDKYLALELECRRALRLTR